MLLPRVFHHLLKTGYIKAVITFTEEELKGVPKDVVSGFTKRTEDGKTLYDVTYKTPDIFPVVRAIGSYALGLSFTPVMSSSNSLKTLRHVNELRKATKAAWKLTFPSLIKPLTCDARSLLYWVIRLGT